MHLIKQKYPDDCTVACVAMLTDLDYDIVLKAAIETGYIPNSGTGGVVGLVMLELEKDCEWRKGLTLDRPCIVSVDSLNNAGGGHVVCIDENDNIFDPSNKKIVDIMHIKKTCSYSYINGV